MVDKFALKAAKSERFGARWFPLRESAGYGLRRTDKYQTFTARTDRMKKSPIYNMRERLNIISRQSPETELSAAAGRQTLMVTE